MRRQRRNGKPFAHQVVLDLLRQSLEGLATRSTQRGGGSLSDYYRTAVLCEVLEKMRIVPGTHLRDIALKLAQLQAQYPAKSGRKDHIAPLARKLLLEVAGQKPAS